MHRVERMRALPPFGRVGLANKNRPRRAHAPGQKIIGRRDEIGKKRRAIGGTDAFDSDQILDRHGQAMQPALGLCIICRAGLRHQIVARNRGDDGVDGPVDGVDPVQMGCHHL